MGLQSATVSNRSDAKAPGVRRALGSGWRRGRPWSRHPAPLEPLPLRWNFLWVATGNGSQAASRGAMLIVLAKLGHTDLIGPLVLALALAAPIFSLAELGLRSALVTDARHQYRFAEYLSVRLATTLLAFLAAVAAAGLACPASGAVLLVGLVAAAKACESLSDIFHGLLQRQERMDRIGIALMLRAVLGLGGLAAGVGLTGSLAWGVAGFALAMAFVLLTYDVPNAVSVLRALAAGPSHPAHPDSQASSACSPKRAFHASTLRCLDLAWTTLPLGIVMLEIQLVTNIPRYVVGYYLGETALGIFAAIYCLATGGVMVISAVGQTVSPRLAKYHAAGNSAAFWRMLAKFLVVTGGLGLVPTVVMAFWGGPILTLVYEPRFAAYTQLAEWLMIAGAILYQTGPLGRALDATRHFRTHMLIRGLTIVMLLALAPPLTQAFGLHGTAWAVLLSAAGSIPLYIWALRRALKS